MNVEIEEKRLSGFNEPAKEELERAVSVFADEVILESYRIESARNNGTDTPQVTSGMVSDAATLKERGLIRPKKSAFRVAIRIAAGVLPLIVGVMYDNVRLQQPSYMATFVAVVAIAIVAVTVSVIQE